LIAFLPVLQHVGTLSLTTGLKNHGIVRRKDDEFATQGIVGKYFFERLLGHILERFAGRCHVHFLALLTQQRLAEKRKAHHRILATPTHQPPDKGILSRTLFNDDRLKVVVFGFGQGEELSEHTASMPAVLHFLRGEAKLTLGDDTVEAKPGTWVHMPSGLRHSIQAKTPVVMLLLLMKPPAAPRTVQ